MTHLVPIKVKICLGPDGKHAYPPFGQLPPQVRGHMDWSAFFDAHGLGWHYDKLSGFGETDFDNPDVPNDHEHANADTTCWYGATCVPKEFADAAVAKWPDRVQVIDEASWELFYDDRAHAHEETEHLDTDALQGLLARVQLEADPKAPTIEPSAEILELRRKMLDPANRRRGIRKNLRRKWADAKKERGITIHPDQAKPPA